MIKSSLASEKQLPISFQIKRRLTEKSIQCGNYLGTTNFHSFQAEKYGISFENDEIYAKYNELLINKCEYLHS